MRVNWVGTSRELEFHRAQRTMLSGPRRLGVSAGGVSVATSGIIAPLVVVGILALAIYGGVKAIGKLPEGR